MVIRLGLSCDTFASIMTGKGYRKFLFNVIVVRVDNVPVDIQDPGDNGLL